MSLAPGTRLGAYEVIGTLGAGGMGEVYRARDARLGRDVAIKVLPDIFTSDADRIARFEREARVLASLNHPNIAAIYGVEEGVSDTGRSVRGLVLELVEGETLGQRVTRRPMVLADTLDVARQLVEALETAHERGIVHRDLKPANISITPEGTVKVLDFGLAKAASSESGAASRLETAMVDGTRDGVILGTVAYMSPEQARGHPVDKRTDIWAFGCVLFEMLTRHVAFHGPTMTDTLAAIVEPEPQWERLPAHTPVAVRQLLQACLVKDAKRRLRDIGDARFSLGAVDASEAARSIPASRGWSTRRWLAVAAAAVLVLTASMALGLWLGRPVASGINQLVRLTVPPPPDTQFAYDTERIAFALSPDGRQLGFITESRGATRVWLRPLSSDIAHPLTGTEAPGR